MDLKHYTADVDGVVTYFVPGGYEGFLWVQQYVRQRVHSNMEVCDVNSHGLLTHSRLVGVTWGLKGKQKYYSSPVLKSDGLVNDGNTKDI